MCVWSFCIQKYWSGAILNLIRSHCNRVPHSPLQETGLIKSNLFFMTFPVSEFACVDTHQATFIKVILFVSALSMFSTIAFCFVLFFIRVLFWSKTFRVFLSLFLFLYNVFVTVMYCILWPGFAHNLLVLILFYGFTPKKVGYHSDTMTFLFWSTV